MGIIFHLFQQVCIGAKLDASYAYIFSSHFIVGFQVIHIQIYREREITYFRNVDTFSILQVFFYDIT